MSKTTMNLFKLLEAVVLELLSKLNTRQLVNFKL